MKRKFRLIKESVEYKKGAIFEEECDDGTQEFITDKKFYKHDDGYSRGVLGRKCVLNQPKWFEEIFTYDFTKSEYKKVKKYLKK